MRCNCNCIDQSKVLAQAARTAWNSLSYLAFNYTIGVELKVLEFADASHTKIRVSCAILRVLSLMSLRKDPFSTYFLGYHIVLLVS